MRGVANLGSRFLDAIKMNFTETFGNFFELC